MKSIDPTRPENLDPLADAILIGLADAPEASNVIIGGGVALNCYLPPRLTHDVDAWWSQTAAPSERQSTVVRIRHLAAEAGAPAGLAVRERRHAASDVVSIELQADHRTRFSFQIAPRDIQLEPPLTAESPFRPVPLETLADNLGAKMTALVSRGAPRDFQDVFAVVRHDVAGPDELWALFVAKNPGEDIALAKAQVLQRLSDIELRRPLETLEPVLRGQASQLRDWVKAVFVGHPFRPSPANGGDSGGSATAEHGPNPDADFNR